MAVTNTLAYFNSATITAVKTFIVLVLKVLIGKVAVNRLMANSACLVLSISSISGCCKNIGS